MNDYHKTIFVSKPVGKVYTAITQGISSWWTNDLAGSSVAAGDQFKIAFGETRKTMELVEALPGKRVVWECVQAYIDMASLNNKAEWLGTEMVWTLDSDGENTMLDFLHKGLNQSLECYQVCEAGWDSFLASLELYLTTGEGNPYLKPARNHTVEAG